LLESRQIAVFDHAQPRTTLVRGLQVAVHSQWSPSLAIIIIITIVIIIIIIIILFSALQFPVFVRVPGSARSLYVLASSKPKSCD